MAVSEAFAVTETVTTTEHSFVTDTAGPDASTAAGVYQGFFDVSALAGTDEYQFSIYEKANSAGTQRLVWRAFLSNAQTESIFATPALMLLHGWDMTWKKLAGTDRSIVGSIRTV